MGPGSEMPLVRTIGNTAFAWILGALSRQRIQDTASGMRVIRRAVLKDLDPLPNGLHYTPAMTARVLLEGKLKLVETPMPYAERVGDSKLSVARDGVRFLVSIVRAAAIYRPSRPLLLLAGLFGLGALALGSGPSIHWLRHASLEEWMIYRILAALLLGTGTALFASAAVVAEQIAAIVHGRPVARTGITGFVARVVNRRTAIATAVALLLVAIGVSAPGLAEYVTTGHVTMHWSRVVLSSLLTHPRDDARDYALPHRDRRPDPYPAQCRGVAPAPRPHSSREVVAAQGRRFADLVASAGSGRSLRCRDRPLPAPGVGSMRGRRGVACIALTALALTGKSHRVPPRCLDQRSFGWPPTRRAALRARCSRCPTRRGSSSWRRDSRGTASSWSRRAERRRR